MDIDVAALERAIALNLTTPILLMQRAAQIMIEQGTGGRIVAVTSAHDVVPSKCTASVAKKRLS